ncbi:MAG: class I SAM-dependent methyltransferase [Candidatus Niyogibacteria bacterium]|nr:class I SAM-dependent methyltransferase [Candidatus Niyogibacteria bacterium]
MAIDNQKALRESYKALSPYSDKQRWEFNNNLVHLDFLTKKINKGTTILDAGCGIGILALALKILGYRNVSGVDKHLFNRDSQYYRGDAIRQLHMVWKKYGLLISEKDILNSKNSGIYDVVISVATIEHQKSPKKFMEGLIANLKKDGYLYIATPNLTHLLNRVRFLFNRAPLSNLQTFFEQGDTFDGHWREYTLNELYMMCEWLHMEVVVAKNVQSMRPQFAFVLNRDLYVNVFRFIACSYLGMGDTNIILARK